MSIKSSSLLIDGVVGDLELVIDQSASNDNSNSPNKDYLAICCHPHPQFGGTLTNKVIYTAARTLASAGIVSIRFNFRGIGQSQGVYDDGIGEQQDLAKVVEWARQQYPDRDLVLVGFSFGAFISISQATALNCSQLISIAPPIGRMDFSAINVPSCRWIIIQGDDDELVDYKQVEQWVSQLSTSPKLTIMSGVSHFFHRRLVDLRSEIDRFVGSFLKS